MWCGFNQDNRKYSDFCVSASSVFQLRCNGSAWNQSCSLAIKWAILILWGRTEGGFYDINAAHYLYGPGSVSNYPPTTFLGVNLCGLSHQLPFTPLLFAPAFMTVMPSQGLPMAKKTPYCYVLYVWTIDWPRLSNVYAPVSAVWVSLMGLARKKTAFGGCVGGKLNQRTKH